MNAGEYWQLFLETGAPEAYLLYSRQMKSEERYAFDNTGHCPEGHGLR